ncbi:type II secretion system minor pseudopilin GspH [Pseudomonas sp. J452]|uniref:type II secretion system minor pseudopilin GspH n=1 Tax=Pseudomonas sp. J452 TaxID=2898441 RepID=UPI0021AD67D0|nr:type II secretion system minor pseudopilin GspH [Pseudomonas sp. J452]UUY07332.1 type II secretion system minor pseudopilin GspH [Pseudomonas sp. J452]
MRAARGFTLIELLVVLVILGTLVSLAVLSSGNGSNSRELRDEAERLAALIGVLTEEAVLEGQEYGLLVSSEGYRVLLYDAVAGSWNAVEAQPERRTPVWARLLLELDGEALQLPEPKPQGESMATQEQAKKQGRLMPQVLILSSGELSPFRLRLEERRAGGRAYLLASDGYQLPSAELAKD